MKIIPLDDQEGYVDYFVPKHSPATYGIIAAKGGGKTTLIINLLMFEYKGIYDKIYVLAPTISTDNKWYKLLSVPHLLKKPKYTEDPDEILKSPFEKKKGKKKDKFTGKMTPDAFIESDFAENLQRIFDEKDAMEDKEARYCVVLDDLAGDKFFKSKIFLTCLLISRHIRIDMFYVSQFYMGLDRSVRINTSMFFIFNYPDIYEKEKFYNEHSMMLPKETWMAIYNHIMSDKSINRPFMTINYGQRDKNKQITNSLEKYIYVNDNTINVSKAREKSSHSYAKHSSKHSHTKN